MSYDRMHICYETIHTVKAKNFLLASKRVISYFKVRYFNMEVYGDWVTFGSKTKCPFVELQLFKLCLGLNFQEVSAEQA